MNGLVGIDRDDADRAALRRGGGAMSRSVSDDLPAPGRAGEADHVGAAGAREQRAERRLRAGLAVVEVAHEPRRGADVAREDPVGDGASGGHQ